MKGAEAAAGGGVALSIIIAVVMVVLLVYANRKRWRGRVAPDPPRRAVSGLLFAGVSSILAADTGFEWGAVVMAEDFSHKYVALVASIIGAVVLLLGMVGVYINLFVI